VRSPSAKPASRFPRPIFHSSTRFPVGWASWRRGLPGRMASSGSDTTGRSSYSTRTRRGGPAAGPRPPARGGARDAHGAGGPGRRRPALGAEGHHGVALVAHLVGAQDGLTLEEGPVGVHRDVVAGEDAGH